MVRIVTDGACSGNPGPGGWAALITRDGEIEEIGGYDPRTTNNRMEMTAAIEALRRVEPDEPVLVVTDSEYLLTGITQWLAGWKRRGWKTSTGSEVLNQDLWEELDRLAGRRAKWEHVRGHRGHPENERANDLAQRYARGPQGAGAAPAASSAAKTRGPRASGRGRQGGELGAGRRAETSARVEGEGKPAHSPGPAEPDGGRPAASLGIRRPFGTTYLSLVAGRLERHNTWGACESRVRGASGARFKKCRSVEEEIATVRGWGLSAEALAELTRGL